jgi:hypothetical protein
MILWYRSLVNPRQPPGTQQLLRATVTHTSASMLRSRGAAQQVRLSEARLFGGIGVTETKVL